MKVKFNKQMLIWKFILASEKLSEAQRDEKFHKLIIHYEGLKKGNK